MQNASVRHRRGECALYRREPGRGVRVTRPRCHRGEAGFSLVELVITIATLGLLLAMTIPAYRSYESSQRLRGAAENLATQIRLARDYAMTTGVDQPLHFYENAWDADFHIHNGSNISGRWNLPRGVHYGGGSTNVITFSGGGRASPSGTVVLRDDRNRLDTLSVMASGVVVLH